MKNTTKIQWCDFTINFWEGCTKVSPGCQHCYAEERDRRWHDGEHWGKGRPRKRVKGGPKEARKINRQASKGLFALDLLDGDRKSITAADTHEPLSESIRGEQVLRYQPVRPLIFTMSLGDFFDPEVEHYERVLALKTIAECRDVGWMVLTKRPERIQDLLEAALANMPTEDQWDEASEMTNLWLQGFPPSHVALGTSIESQKQMPRIQHLKNSPAARRFLSCEPLLSPLYFPTLQDIDLVITGGESGAKARPCHPNWIEDIEDQCDEAKVPFHHKQWGEWASPAVAQPPPGWEPKQGKAIWMHETGDVVGFGNKPNGKGWVLLWNCGKVRAGNALLTSPGIPRHRADLLNFESR